MIHSADAQSKRCSNQLTSMGELKVHPSRYLHFVAEAKNEGRNLQIFATESDAEHPLRILIHVPNADLKQFTENRWRLPGMTFNIQTDLPAPEVSRKTEKRFGDVIEIAFPMPDTVDEHTPVLVLSPVKTE